MNEFESPGRRKPLLRIKLALRGGWGRRLPIRHGSSCLDRTAQKIRPALTAGAPPVTSG